MVIKYIAIVIGALFILAVMVASVEVLLESLANKRDMNDYRKIVKAKYAEYIICELIKLQVHDNGSERNSAYNSGVRDCIERIERMQDGQDSY